MGSFLNAELTIGQWLAVLPATIMLLAALRRFALGRVYASQLVQASPSSPAAAAAQTVNH